MFIVKVCGVAIDILWLYELELQGFNLVCSRNLGSLTLLGP